MAIGGGASRRYPLKHDAEEAILSAAMGRLQAHAVEGGVLEEVQGIHPTFVLDVKPRGDKNLFVEDGEVRAQSEDSPMLATTWVMDLEMRARVDDERDHVQGQRDARRIASLAETNLAYEPGTLKEDRKLGLGYVAGIWPHRTAKGSPYQGVFVHASIVRVMFLAKR